MHKENRYTLSLREASKKICVKANPQPSAETVPYSASNDLKSTFRRHEAKEKMRREEINCTSVITSSRRCPFFSRRLVLVVNDDYLRSLPSLRNSKCSLTSGPRNRSNLISAPNGQRNKKNTKQRSQNITAQ